MSEEHYPNPDSEASFRRAAFDLKVRQEGLRHGFDGDHLADVLESIAEDQRRRVEKSDERLRERRPS